MKNNKFPELKKAIKLANEMKIPLSGSNKYKFKIFSFGERGTKINCLLINEIVKRGMPVYKKI
jgi:hypothetical protein